MNTLDWSIVLLFIGSALLGSLRGGAKEIIGLGGWLRALVFAFFGASILSPLLANLINSDMLRWIASFFVVLIAERLITWGLGHLLAEMISAAHLQSLDKLIGLTLGVLRGAAIILLITGLCTVTLIPTTPIWKGSVIAPRLHELIYELTPMFTKSNANEGVSKSKPPKNTVKSKAIQQEE